MCSFSHNYQKISLFIAYFLADDESIAMCERLNRHLVQTYKTACIKYRYNTNTGGNILRRKITIPFPFSLLLLFCRCFASRLWLVTVMRRKENLLYSNNQTNSKSQLLVRLFIEACKVCRAEICRIFVALNLSPV